MDMEATQRFNDEPISNNTNADNAQVGYLRIGSTEHPIVKGITKIGRSPILSAILVNDISVSKVHAEIQASAETAFISDLRSSNGTKIKDLPLQPFRCYTIFDGDRIYLGTVEAIFTTGKSTVRNTVNLPETPIPSRKPIENITPGNNSCSFNDSSSYHGDDSVVPGTQQKDKKKFVFNEPSVPINRPKSGVRFRSLIASSDSEVSLNKGKLSKPQDDVETTDLHDMETQKFESFLPLSDSRVPESSSKLDDTADANIFDAETQVLLPPEMEATCDKEIENTRENDTSDTHEQSSRNFSRDLQISRSPSPSNALDQIDDIMQSQDLLEMSETSSLQYNKKSVDKDIETSSKKNDVKKSSNGKKSPVLIEESIARHVSIATSDVIADSDDESVTDDELDMNTLKDRAKDTNKRVNDASNVSDEIEDDSATDDEGKFESFASTESLTKEKSKISLKLCQSKAVNRIIETNIFEAETQAMIEEPSVTDRIKKNPVPPAELEIDTDIDLMPTQIFDIANSTPISNTRKRSAPTRVKSRVKVPIEDDIYMAQTQIMSNDNDIVDGDENEENSINTRDVNLDDTISRNLGEILGEEEAKNRSLEDEPTQLLTQNLVDILNPTQCVNETKEIDDEDNTDGGPSCSKRSKTSLEDTLGSVDGVTVGDNWKKTLPTASSTMREDASKIEEVKGPTKTHLISEIIDDDDFFAGLPKVTISGTLSNPVSPTPSTDSDSNESIVDNSTKPVINAMTEPRRSPRSLKTIDPKKFVPDSPKLEKKTKYVRKNLIVDPDSDEEFDYDNLNTMADCLMASINDDFARSRKKLHEKASSIGRQLRQTSKTKIVSKKEPNSSRRGYKLPQTPSSLIVSGVKKVAPSADVKASSSIAGPSRICTRLPKISKSASSSNNRVPQSIESQEIETILAATPKENIPVIVGKSIPKLKLARIDSDVSDDPEYRMVNRKRRATITSRDVTLPPESRVTAKSRRTIADSGDGRIVSKEQYKIIITGLAEDYSKIVKKLGGLVVTDPSQATVLITDRIRRTYKFLYAVAKGLRVVSIKWLIESNKVSRFLDCESFTLHDIAGEKQFRFKLEKSLQMSRSIKFLQGYSILVTPKVNQPEIHELKSMITESGGKVLNRAPAVRAWHSKTVIISREEDIAAAKVLVAKCPKSIKVTVQTIEFILTGILRQEVNLLEHRLDIS